MSEWEFFPLEIIVDGRKFLAQLGISFCVLIFCMYKLRESGADVAVYWGGVNFVVAYWLPSPSEERR